MIRWAVALILIGLMLLPRPLLAATPDAAYQARATQLLTILRKPGGEADFFSTLFMNAVPIEQWRMLAADLRRQHGDPVALGRVTRTSATAGQVEVRYQKATVGFSLVVAPDAPNPVVGLHIVGVALTGDSLDRVIRDLTALPGRTAFAIARLGGGKPEWIAERSANTLMATGSSFKLYILAELSRSVAAKERGWADVIALDRKSFSGRLADWPDHAPMTLHSLATAMIAESDNSASDTLMAALGRAQIDDVLVASGHGSPDLTLPLLTTVEAFALKMPANAALARRYAAAAPAERRALLRDETATLKRERIDVGSVAEKPVAIDSVEWFASPRDMIALLDYIRRTGGDALSILAVNPGIAPADVKRWRYLGYKGGSEPGVMAMNFLGQTHDGQWYAISGSWNDPTTRLDDGQFVALMTRMLNLTAE